MPYVLDEKGKNKLEDVIITHQWFYISIESPNIPLARESYLVQPRVAEYITLLENLVGYEVKLSEKK